MRFRTPNRTVHSTYGLAWCQCRRIYNPSSDIALRNEEWSNFATFEVLVPSTWDSLKPAPSNARSLGTSADGPPPVYSLKYKLTANFELRISETTRNVNIDALKYAPAVSPGPSKYLLDFSPKYHTNLFEIYPHMQDPDSTASQLPEAAKKLYRSLDESQKRAYNTVLGASPCGVSMIHGANGSGKTQLCLTIGALLLEMQSVMQSHPVQILLLMAKNKPLTDTANRMFALCEQLGIDTNKCIRAFNVNYEAEYSVERPTSKHQSNSKHGLGFTDVDTSQENAFFDEMFSGVNAPHIPGRNGRKTDCRMATLREACEKIAREHEGELAGLIKNIGDAKRSSMEQAMKAWKQAVEAWKTWIRATLRETSFVATTPVGASKLAELAKDAFRPVLVIIDDASEVEEASALVALANYQPKLVIYAGDIRQTDPFVRSFGSDEYKNPYVEQLKMSTMQRHFYANVTGKTELTVYHRGLGNLHELPAMFYDGFMEPASDETRRFPPSTKHVLQYLQRLAGGQLDLVPRICVDIANSEIKKKIKSMHNPDHLIFTMKRVEELVHDPHFRSVDGKARGSILIISPYSAATHEYRKAVTDMHRRLDRKHGKMGMHHDVKVDARTINSATSSEADFVIIDMVNDHTNRFFTNKRMCVAFTRALQGEIIIMSKGMQGHEGSWHIDRAYHHCGQHNQVFTLNRGVVVHPVKPVMDFQKPVEQPQGRLPDAGALPTIAQKAEIEVHLPPGPRPSLPGSAEHFQGHLQVAGVLPEVQLQRTPLLSVHTPAERPQGRRPIAGALPMLIQPVEIKVPLRPAPQPTPPMTPARVLDACHSQAQVPHTVEPATWNQSSVTQHKSLRADISGTLCMCRFGMCRKCRLQGEIDNLEKAHGGPPSS